MSWRAHAAGLVLAACIVITAALGAPLSELWLVALAIGVAVQIHALWRRYRDG